MNRNLFGSAPARNGFLCLLFLCALFFVQGPVSAQADSALQRPDKPQYEQLFNCLCDIEVKENGEVDDSGNCGKPLENCSCQFSEKMRTQLLTLDQRGLDRREQIEWMKEKYGNMGKRVLAVPDPANNNWFLAYLVPPAVIVIALLFVGGLGWYWLEDRIRSSDSSASDRDRNPDLNVDQEELAEEIEREVEEHRSS